MVRRGRDARVIFIIISPWVILLSGAEEGVNQRSELTGSPPSGDHPHCFLRCCSADVAMVIQTGAHDPCKRCVKAARELGQCARHVTAGLCHVRGLRADICGSGSAESCRQRHAGRWKVQHVSVDCFSRAVIGFPDFRRYCSRLSSLTHTEEQA